MDFVVDFILRCASMLHYLHLLSSLLIIEMTVICCLEKKKKHTLVLHSAIVLCNSKKTITINFNFPSIGLIMQKNENQYPVAVRMQICSFLAPVSCMSFSNTAEEKHVLSMIRDYLESSF